MRLRTWLGAGVCAAAAAATSADILATDFFGERVLRLSGVDGSVIDETFIDYSPMAGVPWHAMQVKDEIWVADAVIGGIERFSLDGDSWLGTIDLGGPPGAISIDYAASIDRVIVATGGVDGQGFAIVDPNTKQVEAWHNTQRNTTSALYGGGLVISAEGQADRLWAHGLDGSDLGLFSDTWADAGLRGVFQIARSGPGRFLAGGGANAEGSGIAEYGFDGTVIHSWSFAGGAFGVAPMDRGDIMLTSALGEVFVFDRATGDMRRIDVGDALPGYLGSMVPGPGGAAVLLALVGTVLRRRRVGW